jgi:hypothetical protein
MTTRTEKEIERLLRDVAEPRTEWIKQLTVVASGRNTAFFDVGDVGYGYPCSEPESLVNARELATRALNLEEPEAASLPSTIVKEFESADDRSNEHRRGPIRRAEEALVRLTSSPS